MRPKEGKIFRKKWKSNFTFFKKQKNHDDGS